MKLLEKFKSLNFGNKKSLLIALVIVVILAICFSTLETKTTNSTTKKTNNSSSLYMNYINETEGRLEDVLNSIKGISNVKVFLNIAESPKISYLTEEKKSTSQASSIEVLNTIVLAKDGTLTYPIVVCEKLPAILGVLIVATGAGDAKTKLQIINVISSVLNVNVSSIEVLEGK